MPAEALAKRRRRRLPVGAMLKTTGRKHRIKFEPLIVRSDKGRIPRTFLNRWLLLLAAELETASISRSARQKLQSDSELSLVFVSEKEIRRLNREFRQKDKATDVLSFAPTDVGSLGELVFSLEVIRRQAIDHDLTSSEELGYLVLHGVLHLLGYDHERSKAEAEQMFRLQDKIFDALLSRW